MPVEHAKPSAATIKYLYAHAYRCAFDGCQRPLYRVDEQTGARMLNSRVCHIHARSEGGPRWDPTQTAKQNRSEQNLLLLCVEHAGAIDDRETEQSYTGELLRNWKKKQVEEYDKLKQGWIIDDKMVRDIAEASSAKVGDVFSLSDVKLGGEGGSAPGAGGGGGGAIGRNARAGRGGAGGKHGGDHRTQLPNWIRDASRPGVISQDTERLHADLGFSPGAGGGGQGAIGDDLTAGDGGGGGEHLVSSIDFAEMEKDGPFTFEIVVGETGLPPRFPGQHGSDGKDSIVNILAGDGTVIQTLRASRGSGGRSGDSYLPPGIPELSPADIDDGFRITMLMAVNCAELRDGLFFILGGGWTRFPVPRIPYDGIWSVACAARWHNFQGCTTRGMFLSLVRPDGSEVSCLAITIPIELAHTGSVNICSSIGARFDVSGTWRLRLHSGRILLAETTVDISISQ